MRSRPIVWLKIGLIDSKWFRMIHRNSKNSNFQTIRCFKHFQLFSSRTATAYWTLQDHRRGLSYRFHANKLIVQWAWYHRPLILSRVSCNPRERVQQVCQQLCDLLTNRISLDNCQTKSWKKRLSCCSHLHSQRIRFRINRSIAWRSINTTARIEDLKCAFNRT